MYYFKKFIGGNVSYVILQTKIKPVDIEYYLVGTVIGYDNKDRINSCIFNLGTTQMINKDSSFDIFKELTKEEAMIEIL